MTCETTRICPWFNSNKILKDTLPEMRVYTHRVNMAVGSTGVIKVECADKQNDIPDGDNEFYTRLKIPFCDKHSTDKLLLASDGFSRPNQKSIVE